MFSQNVFSAKDVLSHSSHCDNTWDSQQYSQVNSYSQNSQLSSMELFSQQKGLEYPRLDQHQRSQSQTTEDEPSNYYSKYVKNPPLFNGSTNNNQKVTQSIKDIIEEQKRNVSIREERDLLQTFINLLKDYTKEVNSSFENFKDYMVNSFQEITKSISDEAKNYDEDFKKLKEELMSNIEKTDRESNKKQELKMNLLEQTGAIKVLESKVETLEKQLDEAKDKELAYADQKTKYYELEQKYLQSIKNLEYGQGPFLGNTPPLSQPTDPLCTFMVPPQHDGHLLDTSAYANYNLLSNQVPLMTSNYGLNYWDPGNTKVAETIDYYNPPMLNTIHLDSLFNGPLYHETSNIASSASSCSMPTTLQKAATYKQQQQPQGLDQAVIQSTHLHQTNIFDTSDPVAKKPTGLSVSRRYGKRPKQSPMALVRPQVRPQVQDNDIFFCGGKSPCMDSERIESANAREQKLFEVVSVPQPVKQEEFHLQLRSRAIENHQVTANGSSAKKMVTERTINATPHVTNKEGRSFRREESVRRKRTLVSMLGTSSDDLEVQEIANSIKAQQRQLVKKIKSVS